MELAAKYTERAASMRELVNRVFWMSEANRYAYAVDGRDRLLPTVVSNVGDVHTYVQSTPRFCWIVVALSVRSGAQYPRVFGLDAVELIGQG